MNEEPSQAPQYQSSENSAPFAPTLNQPEMTQPTAKNHNSAGILILQWLTYAFWGWTIVALSSLLVSVLVHLLDNGDSAGFTPYGIAAVLVLLPISATCDLFYTKYEPLKKTGGALIIMVIHAVIFALCGIGSLITFVLLIVQRLTSSSTDASSTALLISSIVIAIIYAITFLRTLNPVKQKLIPKIFLAIITLISIIAIVLAIIGPIARERSTRTDRLITGNLSQVQLAINDYARENAVLPPSLQNINVSGDAQKLITDNLVTYTPNLKPSTSEQTRSSKTFYYSLCVNYVSASGNNYSAPRYQDDEYSSYLDNYSHPAGEVCYKLRTTYY